MGAKCVNAVSEDFQVEVRRNGNVYHMGFAKGKTTEPMSIIAQSKRTGTKITFLPDPEIFTEGRDFKYDILVKRLRELAFLNPGIRIELSDERTGKSDVFLFTNGIAQYVTYLNCGKTVLHPEPITFSGDVVNEDHNGKLGRVCVHAV